MAWRSRSVAWRQACRWQLPADESARSTAAAAAAAARPEHAWVAAALKALQIVLRVPFCGLRRLEWPVSTANMALSQIGVALALLCLLSGAFATRELHGERAAAAAWGQQGASSCRRWYVLQRRQRQLRLSLRLRGKPSPRCFDNMHALVTFVTCTDATAMGGMDMSSGSGSGSGMLMGGAGSGNMSEPCYSTPSEAACADFQRSDAGEQGGSGGEARLLAVLQGRMNGAVCAWAAGWEHVPVASLGCWALPTRTALCRWLCYAVQSGRTTLASFAVPCLS